MSEIKKGASEICYVSKIHVNHTRYMYLYVSGVIRMHLIYQVYRRVSNKMEGLQERFAISQIHQIHLDTVYLNKLHLI